MNDDTKKEVMIQDHISPYTTIETIKASRRLYENQKNNDTNKYFSMRGVYFLGSMFTSTTGNKAVWLVMQVSRDPRCCCQPTRPCVCVCVYVS